MDWGNWIELGSVAVAVGAAGVSMRSAKHAERQAAAAEASADVARRQFEIDNPRVSFTIERTDDVGEAYWLVNRGSETAHGVCLRAEAGTGAPRLTALPEGEVIRGNGGTQQRPFIVSTGFGSVRPGYLLATWDGQEEPVPVQLPPFKRRTA